MAKTKPLGVRFDEELLKKVKDAGLAASPQKALNLYEKSYIELLEWKVRENNKPENKECIIAERDGREKKQFLVTKEILTGGYKPAIGNDIAGADMRINNEPKIDTTKKPFMSDIIKKKLGI